MFRLLSHSVRRAINLDHEPGGRAVEIDDVTADWMLPPELPSIGPMAKNLPQHAFGQSEIAPQGACFQHGLVLLTTWRHLPLHHAAHGSPPHACGMRRNVIAPRRWPAASVRSCRSCVWALAGRSW